MKRRAFLSAFFWPTLAQAHSYKLGEIKIGHAWALPSSIQDGQAFMPLVNLGTQQDALVAARSEICAAIELRAHNRYDEPTVREFRLDAKKPFPMRPTSKHLRLIGLRKPLVLGDTFLMILDFLQAGEIEVTVHVEASPGD